MPLFLSQRLSSYVSPIRLLASAMYYFLGNTSRDRGFAELFSAFGQAFSQYEATTAVPKLVASAHGTVLELGPAQGNQLTYFDPARVRRIYGVEPNEHFLVPLQQKITKLDLEAVYTPLVGKVEDEQLLREYGIVPGSLDCVLSIQVLCSVEDPAATAKLLYGLLRPGGRIIMWEHQASRDVVSRWVQRLYNLVWTPTIGGCCLSKEIEMALLDAGEWGSIELEKDEGQPWLLMPHVWGTLVKANR